MGRLSNMKPTLAIFGPTGMLGSAVYNVLQLEFNLVLVGRDLAGIELLNKAYGGVENHRIVQFPSDTLFQEYIKGFPGKNGSQSWNNLVENIGTVDGVINCIGVTNRYSQKDPVGAYLTNSLLPHLMSSTYGHRLLHITTDCIYNGVTNAPYTESSIPSPTDLYGVTKQLGEPSDRSLVLRTSIIGPEINHFVSLLEWVKLQAGKTIHGYTHHLWNGITTKQFGLITKEIFQNRSAYPDTGLFHIFSSDISKFDMLSSIANKYSVDVIIEPDDLPVLDRRLRTEKDLCTKLNIPSFSKMLEQI